MYLSFDFLLYQFKFPTANESFHIECFFIPEHVIPDELYTTHDVLADFEAIPAFTKYRFIMDTSGKWLDHVLKIIDDNPQPRMKTQRPRRQNTDFTSVVEADDLLELGSVPDAPCMTNARALEVMSAKRKRQFFFHIMQQCAAK